MQTLVWKVSVNCDNNLEGANWSADHYTGRTITEAIEKALKSAKHDKIKGAIVVHAEFVCAVED
jgi:hypothetical protein